MFSVDDLNVIYDSIQNLNKDLQITIFQTNSNVNAEIRVC